MRICLGRDSGGFHLCVITISADGECEEEESSMRFPCDEALLVQERIMHPRRYLCLVEVESAPQYGLVAHDRGLYCLYISCLMERCTRATNMSV